MKININKSFKIILFLFILLISIGMVSASDTDLIDLNNNDLSLSNEDNYNVDDELISPEALFDSQSNDGIYNNYNDLSSGEYTKNQLSSNSINSNELSSNIEVQHTGDDLLDIQTAINSANVGDTVSLGDYAYDIGDGQINLTKSISLLGNGKTIINGTGGVKVGCVISIASVSGASIKGITFNNPDADLTYTDFDTLYGWTIRLDGSNKILIDNCSFINYNREINIDGSDENTITNSYFTGGSTRVTNGAGKERGTRAISFSSNSRDNKIINNTFEGAVLDGINIDAAYNTLIIGNSFINNTYAIFLDQAASDGAVISNNTFINCGRFDAVFEGEKIHFEDLPIVACAKSFRNFTFENNTFYVSSNNVLIYVATTNSIGNVNISNNKINLMSNYNNSNNYSSLNEISFDSSSFKNITFIKFPSVESKLDLMGHIILSNNQALDDNLASNLTYGNFGGSLHYLDDGDIIIYGPRLNATLDILFADKIYINSVIINFTLLENTSFKTGLNETITVELNNKTYDVGIDNGFGQLILEDKLESSNYTIKAEFLGNFIYSPVSASKVLEVLGYNTIGVIHTGNDTNDIQDAINKAGPNDTIDLGDYDYKDLETIILNKSLNFIGGHNASVSLSDDSNSLFYIGPDDVIDLTIANLVFNVNKNNESLVFTKVVDDVSSFELDNITVKLDEDISDFLISLNRTCSDNGSSDSYDANSCNYESDLSNNSGLSNNADLSNNSTLEDNYSAGNNSSNLENSDSDIGDNSSNLEDNYSAGNNSSNLENNDSNIENDNSIGASPDILNSTINLIRIESASSDVSFDKINTHNNKLLNGMKAVLISTVPPLRKSTEIIYSNMKTVAVAKADGRVGKYFEVSLKDSDGKALANKKVQIGFNGVAYNRTTNETGGVRLQINLGYAGLYTFAICFLGDDDYKGSFEVALINVTKHIPKLSASDKTFKASSKTKSLTASFKTANGNAISGKSLVFILNGKLYNAKTNSKGVATVKVSISTKGTYSCTVRSTEDGMYAATSTKFKVKII